jgi:hypothetical protein
MAVLPRAAWRRGLVFESFFPNRIKPTLPNRLSIVNLAKKLKSEAICTAFVQKCVALQQLPSETAPKKPKNRP